MTLDDAVHYTHRHCWTRDGDGWRPSERRVRTFLPEDHADAAEDDESLSITPWQTIASHGLEVGREVEGIAAKSCRPMPNCCIWPVAGMI